MKVIAIVGPTASGKTALSIEAARRLNGEIISADSRQVYRGMDIGTAKVPDIKELSPGELLRLRAYRKGAVSAAPVLSEGVLHHLVDIKNPDEDYTLADFKRDATSAIEDISARGKTPMVAGGTGLYVSALLDNWDLPEVKPNPALRRKLEARVESNGLHSLFTQLVSLDPEAAHIVDPKNPRRVIRALEIATALGSFSKTRHKGAPLFDSLKIGISLSAELLKKRIEMRVDHMVEEGLVGEVIGLTKKYGDSIPAFDAIGYREIIQHLKGKSSLEEAVALIKKSTIAFAKRQMTWFKKDKQIHWVHGFEETWELIEKNKTRASP